MRMKEGARRTYRMQTRARSTQATGDRILQAAAAVFWEVPTDQISLPEIARRAGVSVQTIIRRYGSKSELLTAAARREVERVRQERGVAPTGDVRGAIAVLIDHYERTGEHALKMLAAEHQLPNLTALVDQGRQLHRQWCAHVFASALTSLRGAARARRTAQIVAICDVYVWKLLRRDAGLSRAQTELAIVEMLTPLTGAS